MLCLLLLLAEADMALTGSWRYVCSTSTASDMALVCPSAGQCSRVPCRCRNCAACLLIKETNTRPATKRSPDPVSTPASLTTNNKNQHNHTEDTQRHFFLNNRIPG
ncbi:hypothetical protein VTJ04DRAFT_9784 [Mycothermus thermophilus]|uniref:uncharacterized protein n=1 Tax=Humicola insolens TaxID=85995 RepID=UPI0037449171